jgi:tetratricopeptide (TPR) repeat protein
MKLPLGPRANGYDRVNLVGPPCQYVHPNRAWPNFSRAFALVALGLCFSQLVAAQNTVPAPDPVLSAANKARQEGRLADAIQTLQDAIGSLDKTGEQSPRLGLYLRTLVMMFNDGNHLTESMSSAQRALEFDRRVLGPTADAVAADLALIADIYRRQQKYDESEKTFLDGIEVIRREGKPSPMRIMQVFGNLASLYEYQKRFDDAGRVVADAMNACDSIGRSPPCEALRQIQARVSHVAAGIPEPQPGGEIEFGETPPSLTALDQEATKALTEKRFVQAEIAIEQEITWIEQNPKTITENPRITHNWYTMLPTKYNNLAQAFEGESFDDRADDAYKKAIELQKANFDPQHPTALDIFNFSGLTTLYRRENRLAELEPIIQGVIDVQEKYLGGNSQYLAETLSALGDVKREQGTRDNDKRQEAADVYQHVLAVQEADFGKDSTRVASTLLRLAELDLSLGPSDSGKWQESTQLYERALKIQVQNYGVNNPILLPGLNGYHLAFQSLGDGTKAQEIQRRIDAIRKMSRPQAPPSPN